MNTFRSFQEEDNFPYSRSTYLIDPPTSSNDYGSIPGPSVVTFVNRQMKYLEDDQNMRQGMNGPTMSPVPMGMNGYGPLDAITDDVDNPMSLYSVVHKGPNRKTGASVTSGQAQVAPVHRQSFSQQNGGGSSLGNIMEDSQATCCSHQPLQNFEDTDSEYASKLRRQTHKHLLGK